MHKRPNYVTKQSKRDTFPRNIFERCLTFKKWRSIRISNNCNFPKSTDINFKNSSRLHPRANFLRKKIQFHLKSPLNKMSGTPNNGFVEKILFIDGVGVT